MLYNSKVCEKHSPDLYKTRHIEEQSCPGHRTLFISKIIGCHCQHQHSYTIKCLCTLQVAFHTIQTFSMYQTITVSFFLNTHAIFQFPSSQQQTSTSSVRRVERKISANIADSTVLGNNKTYPIEYFQIPNIRNLGQISHFLLINIYSLPFSILV